MRIAKIRLPGRSRVGSAAAIVAAVLTSCQFVSDTHSVPVTAMGEYWGEALGASTVVLSYDNDQIATRHGGFEQGSGVRVLDRVSHAVLAEADLSAYVNDMAADPDGESWWTIELKGLVTKYDNSFSKALTSLNVPKCPGGASGLSASLDVDRDGNVFTTTMCVGYYNMIARRDHALGAWKTTSTAFHGGLTHFATISVDHLVSGGRVVVTDNTAFTYGTNGFVPFADARTRVFTNSLSSVSNKPFPSMAGLTCGSYQKSTMFHAIDSVILDSPSGSNPGHVAISWMAWFWGQPQCNTLSVHRLDTLALEDSVTANSGSGQGDAHFVSLSPFANVVLAFGDLATAADGRNWLHEYALSN